MRKRPPFFNWRTAILESVMSATTKHVLLTVSCHMNDAGESCYPSIERLCRETSLSNRAVITHLRIAREQGWIGVRERELAGKKWAAHGYFMTWPDEHIGSEPGSLPTEEMAVNDVHDQSGNGSERRSLPPEANGSEPRSLPFPNGSERHDQMAVNVVHSSTSVSTSVKKTTLSSSAARSSTNRVVARQILHELNRRTFKKNGRGFPQTDANLNLISARIRETDAAIVFEVTRRKILQWWGSDMEPYLRPLTLYGQQKFSQYAGEIGMKLRRVDKRKVSDAFTPEQLDVIQAPFSSPPETP